MAVKIDDCSVFLSQAPPPFETLTFLSTWSLSGGSGQAASLGTVAASTIPGDMGESKQPGWKKTQKVCFLSARPALKLIRG